LISEVKSKLSLRFLKKIDNLIVGISFYKNDGLYLSGINSRVEKIHFCGFIGNKPAEVIIPSLNHYAGSYIAVVSIADDTGYQYFKYRSHQFKIITDSNFYGIFHVQHK